MASGSVVIPLRDSLEDESIEINLDELPDSEEVLQILRAEKAALHLWIRLGLEYYRRGHYDDFVKLLECSGSEASLDYEDVQTDQMKALDILAAYFVRTAHRERTNKEKKRDMFARATLLYTTADKLKMYDMAHLTGRAYFCLFEGRAAKLDQATQQFNFVLKQNPNDIAAMMGMACITFNKKEYKTSLYYYKKCLRQKPDGPADFRVGIGFCLARMGKYEKARIAFERALEIQPNNVAALSALAIMDGNEQTADSLQAAIQRLGLAYKLESENPVVLIHLANHFFYRRDLSRVEQLAWHAMGIAESDQIKAEACFQLARCFHYKQDYDRAFKYYYQATTLNHASFILPYFGLGQLHIQRGEHSQAITAFETILKVHPNNAETLKIVGSLYAHSEGDKEKAEYRQKAKDAFTKLLTLLPDDIEVLIDLAQLLEASDPTKSLAHYERACELLRDRESIEPPAEMLNNMGSLHMFLGNYDKAKECYEEADAKLQEDVDSGSVDGAALTVTIRYNLARCMEHLCLFDDASKMYQLILRKKENYVDCMIRLGCMARDRGQIYDASVWFKEAMSVDQLHADAWTLIGNLHMAKHEWGPAQKKFEHILKMNEQKPDPYSLIALGNIWLESLFNSLRDRKNDPKFVERALQMFTRAIKLQPKNMWAANGIGCVLAHKKLWLEARDVFTQVREATADFFDVWINIAHVYMETRQYVPAIQMYSNAMKKFQRDNDPAMQMYLARAFYRAKKLTESRQAIEKAVNEAPDNLLYKFNHAFILKKIAKAALEDQKATTKMVNGAMDDLRTADRILSFISTNQDDTLGGVRLVSRTMAGEEARECRDLLQQAQTYLSRAKKQDEEEDRLRAKQEEERQALLARLEQENQQKEDERRRKEEEQRNLRHTYVEMTKDILRIPELVEEKKSRGGGGRKKKGGAEGGEEFVNDSSDMGDWRGENGEEGGGERRKKDKASKKASRKRREKEAGGGSGSDDEERRKDKKKRKAEAAAARKAEQKLSAKQSSKIKSRAFLSSDEDSSDGGGAKRAEPMDVGGDSPPAPRISSSESEDSEPKPRKKKPVIDSENSDSDRGGGAGSDSDVGGGAVRSDSSGGSEPATSPTKKTRTLVDSDDSD